MMNPWRKRIFALPHVPRDAKLVLHQTLDKIPRVKAVSVIIQWDDDTWDCDWSPQPASHLCMASTVFGEIVRRIAMGEDPPGVPEPREIPPRPDAG